MGDLIGLVFFVAIAAAAFFGLRAISKTRARTEEEFEKGAEQSASLLSAGVNALHGMLDPAEGRGKETVRELQRGRGIKNARDEKNLGTADGAEHTKQEERGQIEKNG